MKHQYKERLAGVRKIVLLPLCIGVLALFSFNGKSGAGRTRIANGICAE